MVPQSDPFGRMRRSCPEGIPMGKTVEAVLLSSINNYVHCVCFEKFENGQKLLWSYE